MSSRRITIDTLITNLLQETSCTFHDTVGVEWEWKHYNKVYNILQQIREKEAGRDSNDTENSISDVDRRLAKLPAFIAWLNENGIIHNKIEVVPTRSGSNTEKFDGFGLRTKVAMKAADLVFKVPEEALITTQKARDSKLQIIAKKDPLLRSMDNVLLAIYLLYEKYVSCEGSFWKPYIDILPIKYDTFLYFEPDEMKLLRHSPASFRETLKMYRNIARQYAYFHSVFRKSNDSGSRGLRNIFTYRRYIWAVSSVITRQNTVPRSNNMADELCLVPLWDLCNHEESAQFSTDYNTEEKCLVCFANRDYEAKEEFKIFYGHRSTVDYFVHGGFVPQSHTCDLYHLELGINKNDVHFERKKVLLAYHEMEQQMAFSVRPDRITTCQHLFLFVRVFQANAETLDLLEEKQNDFNYLSQPTEQIWTFLATRFLILKNAQENNLAKIIKIVFEEKAISEEKQLTSRELMVLQLFKNEKKLLDLLAACCADQANQLKKLNE